MSKKFIPNGHQDFLVKAESLARTVSDDPQRFGLTQADGDELSAAAIRLREAYQATKFGARSDVNTESLKEARAAAVQIVRRIGRVVRSNERIDGASKVMLGIKPRADKPKQLPVPKEPPRLRFVRALHEGNGSAPVHVLEFSELHSFKKTRPEGAVRIELFTDLVPEGEPIPNHPSASARPLYLRSYTRNPITLQPLMPRVPMRVVYWGRWADSSGAVGPFSATAVGWTEGGSHRLLPGGEGMQMEFGINRKPPKLMEDAHAAASGAAAAGAHRGGTFVVAVLEAQQQAYGLLVEPEETKQLEGPEAMEEAA